MFSSIQSMISGLSFCTLSFSLVALILFMGFYGVPIYGWVVGLGVALWLMGFPNWLIIIALAPLILMSIPPLRAMIATKPIMALLEKLKMMPVISQTEKTAIEAGSTWVEGELFSGKPNFGKIFNEPYGKVTSEEREFIETKCRELCDKTDDWQIYHDRDLPPEIWEYLKKEKFFGLIIPKEYGGLGFSALAHSEIISYLTSRSIPLAITAMVPNSLGPAELLLHYGTQAQKDKYLPRLAVGDDVPCFGLTEPEAGSDAGSMTSSAVVFKGDGGKLFLKMNWNKRYITLGAVSSLLGIAIKVLDPENLLGKGEKPGITCVLVPGDTKGVVLGKRHDPMGVPFFNCPIQGNDVVLSVDQIIGGPDGAGDGWRMLMECLAAGRSISLPAQGTATSKLATRVAGAYSEVRHQFGMSIGKFEGVEEVLGNMGGTSYMLEASRIFTACAVDSGIKPAVVSAIAKLRSTEEARKVLTNGMDILGGAAISRGPRNLLGHAWWACPIGITVEGANILTRTMIIFGQGAIRCHPYAYKELTTLADKDLKGFDDAFWGHMGHVVRNGCRSVLLSITRGRLAMVPGGPMKTYYRKLAWTSASFAILADVAMGAFGGTLKFREKVTGRFADILSGMYLATSILRRFEAEGRRIDHEDYAAYALEKTFLEIQEAFGGLYSNLDIPVVGKFFKYVVGFWSRLNPLSSGIPDSLGKSIAQSLMVPGDTRDSITSQAIYFPKAKGQALADLENAFELSSQANAVYRKIRQGMKDGVLKRGKPEKSVEIALEKTIISQEESETVSKAIEARQNVIQVDSFDVKSFAEGGNTPA